MISVNQLSNQEESLLKTKNNALYKAFIREISTSPFTTFHWSSEAVKFASKLPRNTKYFSGLAGSLCQNFVAPDGSSSENIYPHSFGFEISGQFVSICELSSDESLKLLLERFCSEGICTS